jgi:hypothetical protein
MPDPTATDGEPRDDRVAQLLAVEPLDEVTRRRLVTTALRRGVGHRRRNVFIAASVAAVLATGGGAWLLTRTGSGPHRVVAAPTTPGAGPSGAQANAGAAVPARAPLDLGDFGNLNDPAAVARLRAAAQSVAAAPPLAPRNESSLRDALATALRCDPGAGQISTVATGTLDGQGVLVLVAGERLVAVGTAPCDVQPLG